MALSEWQTRLADLTAWKEQKAVFPALFKDIFFLRVFLNMTACAHLSPALVEYSDHCFPVNTFVSCTEIGKVVCFHIHCAFTHLLLVSLPIGRGGYDALIEATVIDAKCHSVLLIPSEEAEGFERLTGKIYEWTRQCMRHISAPRGMLSPTGWI